MPFAMSEFGWDGNGWNSTNNATWNKNIPDVLNRIGWNSEIADKYAKLGWDIKKLNACQTPLQVTLSYLEDRMERCGANAPMSVCISILTIIRLPLSATNA